MIYLNNYMMNMFQLYLMGIIYAILGVLHFTNTGFYRPLMPKFMPSHDLLIYLSGVAEIILGIGVLFPQSRNLALWGIILMLLVFFNCTCKHVVPIKQTWHSTLGVEFKNPASVCINLLGLHPYKSLTSKRWFPFK